MMDVKAGDKVVISSFGFGSTKYVLKTVNRTTRTQIIVGNQRFDRNTGVQIGGASSWRKDRLYLATDDMLEKVNDYQNQLKKYHLVKDLSKFNWNKFDLERLNEIAAFVGLK
jgi:hypothetical protein